MDAMLREGPGSLPLIWLVVLRCVVEKALETIRPLEPVTSACTYTNLPKFTLLSTSVVERSSLYRNTKLISIRPARR